MRWSFGLVLAGAAAFGQDKPAEAVRVAGGDADSGIAYVLLPLEGRALGPVQPVTPPRLTAQCTRDAGGKLRFELLVDEGGAPALRFVAPWKATKESQFRPPVETVTVTMEYLGYVKEKPVKRQWDRVNGTPEELRYAAPGMASHNLEEVARCLQYLRSLPGLRISIPGRPVLEFATAGWQARVKAESLCGASGL